MTRGKYTQRAAVRRTEAEHDAEIGTYQKKVRDQHKEIQRLREQLKEESRSHRAVIGRLSAELAEGISPMVQVLQRENRRMRDERDAAVARDREIQRRWENLNNHLLDLLRAAGLGHHNQIEVLIAAMDDDPVLHTFVDNKQVLHGTKDPEGIRRIQRARGERS